MTIHATKETIAHKLKLTRKHKVIVHEATSWEIHGCDLGWSGGSRSAFFWVNAETGETAHVDTSGLSTWMGGKGVLSKTMDIEPGWILVETGTFCGKPATLSLIGRREDILV